MTLFPLFYNAPVSFYALMLKIEQDLCIEVYDHYSKQTYRNRCAIMGANGIITLSIPVVKDHGEKKLMKDVRIDYSTNWHLNHWRSIFSAYASAPFFEFMIDTFEPFYRKKYNFLADLNQEIMIKTVDLLQWERSFSRTKHFSPEANINDFRESIHPKKSFFHNKILFRPVQYHQVFSDRHGFIPDLSIIDLLFNEGPNANNILKESLTTTI